MAKLPNYLLFRNLALASLSGSRSLAGPALAACLLNRNSSKALCKSHLPFKHLQNPAVANTLTVLALGELVGDKMPFAPNRTQAIGLAGRTVSGAFTGAALLKAERGNAVTGIILGGACALAATFASFYLRRNITGTNRLTNVTAGLVEDVFVLGMGAALIAKFNNDEVK